GLDPLELADGLREFVAGKTAALRVDDLDRRADPLCRLGAGHRRLANRRETRIERRDPCVTRVEERPVDVEEDGAEPRHVKAPPLRAARCRRPHGESSGSPCLSLRGPWWVRP